MGLKLQTVPAAQGLRWVQAGFKQFFRHPIAYASVLSLFMVAVMLVSLVPVIGGPLVMAAVPLLSLAFMHATHEGHADRRPRAAVLVAMWRPQVPLERRRTLMTLCLAYALLTLLGLWAASLVDRGGVEALLDAMSSNADSAEIEQLANAPGVFAGAVARLLVTALLGVPFWHAPALVLWGGQSLGQALFSSTLAIWRCRGAFTLYALGWVGAMSVGSLGLAMVMGALGLGQLSGLLVMPLALLLSSAYYVSLYFTFVDSFGQPQE